MLKALQGVALVGELLTVRRALRARVREYVKQAAALPARYLVLVFGSVARGEHAQDLDLIVVSGSGSPDHGYRRVAGHHYRVDLNVVTESWLRDAWHDVEYGYWLNESYVLAGNDAALLTTWKQSCNLYWSPASASRRTHAHRAMTLALLVAGAKARDAGLTMLERLLRHEAARAAGCAVIDRHGSRIFSHQTFVSEVTAACAEAAVPASVTTELLRSLSGGEEGAAPRFLRLRQEISRLLRDPSVSTVMGHNAADTREKRIGALCRLAQTSSGVAFEDRLASAGLDAVLPTTEQQAGLLGATDTLLKHTAPSRPLPFLQKHSGPSVVVPSAGDIPGARWTSCEDGRLKIIVNSGGCKTPSCAFCALPVLGRSAARADLAQTVNAALVRHDPQEVALYNDGNLLNPREVSPTQLRETCDLIGRRGITQLTIESIPRFVTCGTIADVKRRSRVQRLVVALGLQSIGNAFAVGQLGRPDVDALFDYAIDEVHDAGAQVRLYLLWGFGDIALDAWADRLAASIEWARARGVEILSVCPYAPPIVDLPLQHSATSLDWLREIIRPFQTGPCTKVEIVGAGLASCAPQRGA